MSTPVKLKDDVLNRLNIVFDLNNKNECLLIISTVRAHIRKHHKKEHLNKKKEKEKCELYRKKLRQKLNDSGISILQLANTLGITRCYLYKILNGHRVLSKARMIKIEEVLKTYHSLTH